MKLTFILLALALGFTACNRNSSDTHSGAGGSSSQSRQMEETAPSDQQHGMEDTEAQGHSNADGINQTQPTNGQNAQ